MGAVLSCGRDALLSHRSAGALWGLVPQPRGKTIEVVVPLGRIPRRADVLVHRRVDLGPKHRREKAGIPVTDPVSTLVDLASCSPDWLVEQAVNAADRLELLATEALRGIVVGLRPRPGMARMRRVLGLDALTDTGLERKFLAIVRAADLPRPETQVYVNGYRVDFHWPDLGLVVETDGWRYHRTSAEQATDHRRDQTHAIGGLTTMRFAEDQIRYEPDRVRRTLAAMVARLSSRSAY